jgi:hypothetical protein
MNEDLESKRRIILRKYLDGLISRREARVGIVPPKS